MTHFTSVSPLPSTVSNCRLMRLPRQRQGYALLLVLVVLALAGTLLALIVRRTASQARDALMAERALQARWGMASCENLLNYTEELLVEPDAAGKSRPAASRAFQFALGKRKVAVVLADEQAKPNLNALAGRWNARQLTDLIHRRVEGMEVSLDPLAGDKPFVCWEQIFPQGASIGVNSRFPSSAVNFTLWGDGKLCLRTASVEATNDFLKDALDSSQIEQLRAAVQKGMLVKDAAALLPREIRGKIEPLLTDESKAKSVWVVFGGPEAAADAAPHDIRFTVVAPEEKMPVRRFSWP